MTPPAAFLSDGNGEASFGIQAGEVKEIAEAVKSFGKRKGLP